MNQSQLNELAEKYMKKFPKVKKLRLTESDRHGKRLKALFMLDGKKHTIHFGDFYSETYYDGASETKRRAYQARASKIKNKEGEFTYMIPGTANSFSYWLLW